jgi:NitT/TauT family transport system ATP-binding protein
MIAGLAASGVVSVENLTHSYTTPHGRFLALGPISIEIEESRFLSVLGPSGCGKSTLLRVVGGLNEATSGRVYFRGEPVKGPPKSLGIVFQSDLLMPWRTVLQNVMLQAEIRHLPSPELNDRAMELLRKVGLESVIHAYPDELSGGMRQRVGICRALVHDPQLLLMDEPFGALDAITRDQMCIELQRIWMSTRKTVMFVTHSIEEAIFLSDRILVMTPSPGRVALDIEIDLPRPRRLATKSLPEFQAYANQLRGEFERFGLIREDA